MVDARIPPPDLPSPSIEDDGEWETWPTGDDPAAWREAGWLLMYLVRWDPFLSCVPSYRSHDDGDGNGSYYYVPVWAWTLWVWSDSTRATALFDRLRGDRDLRRAVRALIALTDNRLAVVEFVRAQARP